MNPKNENPKGNHMLKYLLSAMLFLCCADCVAQPHISLVVTLDPGESVMVKSADGKQKTFIDYTPIQPGAVNKGVSVDDAYHLEYHLIIWMQCDGCGSWYDMIEGGCPNQYCPRRYG
jgi:hypothetical protein